MRKGVFGLKVINGDELDNGLVLIKHMQQYKLRLTNFHTELSCDASLEIDGKFVGRFRVKPYSSILIDRPTNDRGIFTFYKKESFEAGSARLTGQHNDGIICVTFYQEIPDKTYVLVGNGLAQKVSLKKLSKTSNNFVTGGTGLSGISQTSFSTAKSINIGGKSECIVTRLVCHDQPRPLI